MDTSKAAFGIQIQGYGTIPGLTTPGVNIWTAAAGTNPIGAFLTEGGWLTVGLLVANQNFVIGGINLEIDGSGNAPYSRMNQLQGVGTYLSRNAFYNGSAWAFDDTSVPASALAILQDGTVQVLSAPAGSTLTWTAINSITTTGQVLSPPTTTLAGTTAGNVYWAQPEQGTRKVFIAVADGYENDTTTNQTITFPAAYTYPPTVSTNTTGLTITVTTTALTITAPDNTTLYNGVVEVIGI